MGTAGENSHEIMIPASGLRMPRSAETRKEEILDSVNLRSQEQLFMNGPAVFHFSVEKIPAAINDYLAQQKLEVDDLDLVFL